METKMIKNFNGKHIILASALIIFSAFIISSAVGQVSTQNSGSYDLNITTDPVTNIKETEATFQATVDVLDSNFDAALVYWNYSTDSSLNQKGPADLAFTEEQVSTLASGLAPDTGYNVEAYAEPVVWNDETLGSNVAKKMDRQGLVSNFLSYIGSSISGSNVNSLFANMNQEGFENWVSEIENNPEEVPSAIAPDLSTINSGSPQSELTTVEATGTAIGPQGKHLLVVDGDNTDDVTLFNLTNPWDLSSAVKDSGMNTPVSPGFGGGGEISGDGKKVFVSDSSGQVVHYDLSTAWDLSSATQNETRTFSYSSGMDFSPDGTRMVLSNRDDPHQATMFRLSTPWDLNSATNHSTIEYSDVDFGFEGDGVALSYDGSKIYIGGQNNGVYSFELSQPWNLESSTLIQQDVFGTGMGLDVSPDGTKAITGYTHGDVRLYSE